MGAVKTSIAAIGTGLIGARHVEILARLPDCQLASIIDPSPAAADIAKRHGVPHFEDLGAALKAPLPDGVIIASPNQLHIAHATQCLAAGLPMLIEKPIGAVASECAPFVDAAEHARVPVLVGHHRRHNPIIQHVKETLAAGALGDIVAVNAMCWLYKPDDYYTVTWRTQAGAGPVFINLIHDIDLLRWLVGDISAVSAVQSSKTRGHAVEDTAALTLEFTNGALGTVTVSDTIVAPWSWELTAAENPAYPETAETCYFIGGTHGSLEVPSNRRWGQAEPRSWWRNLETTDAEIGPRDPLDAQIQHFCCVIAGNEPPLVSAREGLQTLRVIEAIKQAAQFGVRVSLQDFVD